ncbi:MAG: efflux RND transporter periplasmic adaptor subunit [Oscillospiraceae bacterium]|nr:efflux RND transporter periplasmic adaptor subunit [Oscillospiraceae bacterium]
MSETVREPAQQAQLTPPQSAPKPRVSRARRRRMIRRVIKYAVLLAVLVTAGILGWNYYSRMQAQQAQSEAPQYTQTRALQGALDVHVYGSGAVTAANQPNVYVEADGTLTDLRVDVGDAVSAGQILAVLENDALDEEIASLEYALWSADNTITTTSAGSDVEDILSPSAGRVMKLYAKPGDDALAVYRRFGSVALLSTDGRMKVELDVAEDVTLTYGEVVTVSGEGFSREGSVTDLYLQGTRAVVTIVDDTLPMDAPATVTTKDGKTAGTGALAINKPMAVSAFGGTIKKVRVAEGDMVYRKTGLYTLEDSPITLKVEDLRLQRQTAAESLQAARDKRENLIVRAPVDGVVATVDTTEGADLTSGTLLCSILQGEDMVLTIAVDELDVVKVAAGQPVNISVDALPDTPLVGTVEKIAPVGTAESGVSTYNVRLNFDAAGTGVRPGMNASGQIQVAHLDDAVYLPVEAIQTINNESYVLVAGDYGSGTGYGGAAYSTAGGGFGGVAPQGQNATRQQAPGAAYGGAGTGAGTGLRAAAGVSASTGGAQSATAGTLRPVTLGLSNDDYVQVTSGLTAGETVLYLSTGTSASSGNQMVIRSGAMPMMGF